MKIENVPVTLRVLKPEIDGNWLTNGDTYGQAVYLGDGDSPDNWREITPEAYEAAQAAHIEQEDNP